LTSDHGHPAEVTVGFSGLRGDIAAAAAGALLATAFPPLGWWPVAFFSPAVLFLLWQDVSPARAALRGAVFSFGLFAFGVWWLYVALANFGGMPQALAVFALVLFFAYLSLFLAAAGYVQARLFGRPGAWKFLAALPALWVLAEWLRGWLLTGFPWVQLGCTQLDTPLAGFAPLAGPYGVALAVTICAGALALMARTRRFGFGIAVIAGIVAAGWGLGRIAWTTPAGAPLAVALVQGNVALQDKWTPSERARIIERYIGLTRAVEDVALVVWPETAVPGWRADFERDYAPGLEALARERGFDLLAGLPEAAGNSRREYYNSAIALGGKGVYRKRHLVPFGEFLPARPLFGWLLDYLEIPLSDFSAGARAQQPMLLAGQPMAVSICYEFAFPQELRSDAVASTVLVNLSEDAWYGDSSAMYQHDAMTRTLALSLGRPVARATNTGVTAVADHRGRTLARAPVNRAHVLVAALQPMSGRTPFAVGGNLPAVLTLVAMLGVAAVAGRRDALHGTGG
jgi:apolipoprotein N-acyltransferase